ncbi:MAG: hypothetical protein WA705_18005 [Candidatus Ozemobacteraceae bacterium]
MKKLGIAGCLASIVSIFLPLTYFPSGKQYMSYFSYGHMSGKLMVGLMLLTIALWWLKNQIHLVPAVILAAAVTLLNDTTVFFLPKTKIFLSWGFYLMAGALLFEFLLALRALRPKD